MAEITAKAVKTLREQTGAGMMDCKRVLQDAGGDLKRAVELLRERGIAKAGTRQGRVTSEGAIVIAIADSRTSGGIVELGCETDFVARTDEFCQLGQFLAQSVVANAGLTDRAALEDAEIDGAKVRDRVAAAIAKLGENITISRFARFKIGEAPE